MLRPPRRELPVAITAIVAAFTAACLLSAPVHAGVRAARVRAEGVAMNVVTADLNQPEVRVVTAVARGFPRRAESFSSLIRRTKPVAAINGTFFGTRNLSPVGDIVVVGRPVYFGRLGMGLAVRASGRAEFVNLETGRIRGWEGYRSVVCAGPRLIMDGQFVLDPRTEGFRDPHVLGSARRSALALTKDNRLLLVTTTGSVTLGRLARALRSLGARWAINLDGGTSSGLYYRGKFVTSPGRSLTNWILVYDSPERLAAAQSALAPTRYWSMRDRSAVMLASRGASGIQFGGVSEGSTIRGVLNVVMRLRGVKRAGAAVIYIDDQSKSITNNFPHEFKWDTTALADGPHSLSVELYDPDNDFLSAQTVNVTVRNAPARDTYSELELTLPRSPSTAPR